MTTQQQTDKVQKLENFAAKIAVGGARKYDHVTPFIQELKWLKINNKITFEICIFTYKICNHLLPEWLFAFPTVNEAISRNTRQSNDLFISRTKTDLGAKAISVKGPLTWKNIPDYIKKSPSL